jgi:oligopeptide transport system substrate-binding protein
MQHSARLSAWRIARIGALAVSLLALLVPASFASPVLTARQAAPAGEIRIPITEPPQMDPGITSDSVSIDVIMHIFEALVSQDANGNIQPAVAQSWDLSDDGLTYTFHLRQGPVWSDGKPVTAQDFEWAWKRNIDPKTASDYATSLYPVKNGEAINNGKMDPSQLGVKAIDDQTLVVTLEKPAAYFLTLASTWTLMPLRADVVTQWGDKWVEADHIVTNGPYLMKEWTHDQQIVLEANPNYWGPKPQIQRAIFKIFPDGAEDQALAAYEAGELDTFGTILNIPPQQVDRVKADPSLGYMTYDESGTYFVTVNNRKEYLHDPRVRKALGMSVERQTIISDVLRNTWLPAYTLQAPGIKGRNPDLWPKEDLQAARQMLADAGFPDGKGMPALSYAYNTNVVHKLVAEYLQQRWQSALGLTINLNNMDWKVFLAYRHTDDWAKGGDLFRGGWFSDYEDPNNWYNLLWDSNSDPGQFNSGWQNAQYDQIVRDAAGDRDPASRVAKYAQAEQILANEYPNIPLFHYAGATLVRPYVHGMNPSRVLAVVPLETMTVDPH